MGFFVTLRQNIYLIINKMGNLYLPSFYIKGFKSIEEMDLNSLSAINLIAGDNNVGKSTILEAMYAFVTNGHPEAFAENG